MIAADRPVQRPPDGRLLVVDAVGRIRHVPRASLLSLLRPTDLLVANDAATFPASLRGIHETTGNEIEVRLARRQSLAAHDINRFWAVVFGAGDFRTRTEDRPAPPALSPGDRMRLGPLRAVVEQLLDHPRLAAVRFHGSPDAVWAGLARHGRPVQYAHVPTPLELWDVWTPIAGAPAAFEPPSAGFTLDWALLRAMRRRGIGFATVTLAAGISSTGDPALDARLPFPEPYRISDAAADAINTAKASGARVVAVGTTVVRALEHAAGVQGRVRAGEWVADELIGPDTRLRVADAILSGTHEPGSSHYQVLRAFARDAELARADEALEASGYRTHEFGDSVLVERSVYDLKNRALEESPPVRRHPARGWSHRLVRRSACPIEPADCPARRAG